MNRDDLKVKVLALAAEGRTLRARIGAARGAERDALWNEKRAVGRRARVVLLAYAFVRGVPYARVERRTASPPNPYALADVWWRELGWADGIPVNPPYGGSGAVLRWLAAGEPATRSEVAMT